MQRRMLGRDGRQRTPAGGPGASQLPQVLACGDPDTPSQNFSASTTVQLNVQ